MHAPYGSLPYADYRIPSISRPPAYSVGETEGMLFFASELEVFRPGGSSAMVGFTYGEDAHAARPPVATTASDYLTLRTSNIGYVTPRTDSVGTLVYPPLLDQAFTIDSAVDLSLAGTKTAVSWGSIRIMNDPESVFDTTTHNCDGRAVRVIMGRKTYDATRGIWVNPSYSAMAELFSGLAEPWQPDETGLTIPVRDATVWTERELQNNVFAGTGTVEGTANMVGRPKPKLRGGTGAFPVLNISPILIDPITNVWAFNDGPGLLTNVYENGAAVYTYDGDTTDLWTGSTSAGAFRTDSSKGLFQLGTPKPGQITCDAVGSFPFAGLQTSIANVARYLLTEDMAIPDANIDLDSFATLNAIRPYKAGWYWDGSSPVVGADAVALFLASVGARLGVSRSGKLRAIPLQAVTTGTTPINTYTADHIVSVKRQTLPAEIATPPMRLRWGYGHNHTVMTSSINPTVTDTYRKFLMTEDNWALWSSVSTAYRRQSDPAPLTTALLDATEAATMVNVFGDLWGVARKLMRIELPVSLGIRNQIGDVIVVTFPSDGLDAGQLGTVVGESMNSQDSTTTLLVLI